MRKKYETDLTDEQWDVIAPLFVNMRKRKWDKRELVNAVLYLVKTGCQWRNLPHDFPPVFTVHSFYRRARLSGLWDKILEHIVKLTRQRAGLSEEPTQALIDSQSVKTTGAVEQKKTKGVKRQIVTDDIGCLLSVPVHKANLHDTKIGCWVAGLTSFAYPTLQKICGWLSWLVRLRGLQIFWLTGCNQQETQAARSASLTKTLDSRANFCLAQSFSPTQ